MNYEPTGNTELLRSTRASLVPVQKSTPLIARINDANLMSRGYGCVCLIAVLNPRYNTAVLYHPFFPCILNCIIETPIWVKGLL
jgi:hypothetical protein